VAKKLSVFDHTTLISGPEKLLADRAVAARVAAARAADPDTEVSEVDAGQLDRGTLAEISSPSLFASCRVAVIRDLGALPGEVHDDLLRLTAEPGPELGFLLVHPGGNKGKALLTALKKTRPETVNCPTPKPWELPRFATAEAKRHQASMDTETAQTLIDAVGQDLRSLSTAISQLATDSAQPEITRELVQRYFGGRAEVTSFAVADAAVGGRSSAAMEQLRWALGTGAAPVLITSALASALRGLGKYLSAPGGLRDADLAGQVGVPPWKLKTLRAQARGWDEDGLAVALQAVATADAEVKGAADDPEYALERAVLTVARRRS
jgi:DNA polymerase-3 subunit delta